MISCELVNQYHISSLGEVNLGNSSMVSTFRMSLTGKLKEETEITCVHTCTYLCVHMYVHLST